METADTRFLIQQKIEFISMVGNVSMLWWVSSVAFCGSLLATVWLNRDELVKRRLFDWVCLLLFVFFLSAVRYGLIIVGYTNDVQKEMSELATDLNAQPQFFSTELSTLRAAIWNGTSSFVLFWAAGFYMWINIGLKKPMKILKKWMKIGLEVWKEIRPRRSANTKN